MKHDEQGFSIVEGFIILLVIALLATAGWYVFNKNKPTKAGKSTNNSAGSDTATDTGEKEFVWQRTNDGWEARNGDAPSCDSQPMLINPVDINKVTYVLYPGQVRGGNYKPHGGLRLDGTNSEKISIKAPLDGFVIRGSRYIEQGEVQYSFDVFNNCGIMYRLDHLLEISDELKALTSNWPDAQENDSRTHNIDSPLFINQGDEIASSVGYPDQGNIFFDLGVYDFRQRNEASGSLEYQQKHGSDKELSWHAVCWLKDWIPESDQAILRNLPAGDSISGKTSDYCL